MVQEEYPSQSMKMEVDEPVIKHIPSDNEDSCKRFSYKHIYKSLITCTLVSYINEYSRIIITFKILLIFLMIIILHL